MDALVKEDPIHDACRGDSRYASALTKSDRPLLAKTDRCGESERALTGGSRNNE
jgi:hypothetical protein